MTRVLPLSYGWTLVRDGATGNAFFEKRGHALNPGEFSAQPEARTIFREVKRRLDVMDETGYRPDDRDWLAVDRAKLALQLHLKERRRWTSDLLETGV